MNITGFIHCATIGNWKEILLSQIDRIKKSNLYEKSRSVHIGILGKEHFKINDKKINIYTNPSIELAEGFTLEKMQNQETELIWYIHTKGVSKQDPKQKKHIRQWRKIMEHIVIDKFESCIEKLKSNDVCGCFWDSAVPHFSGNFWWANSKYINKLENINVWCGKNFLELPNRFRYELWIGSGDPKAYSFIPLPNQSLYLSKNTIRLI